VSALEPPFLRAEGLCKTYRLRSARRLSFRRGTFHALRDASFQIARGEVLAVVGESGSGKSTLARLLVKLLEPTSGDVVLEGKRHRDRRGEGLRALRRTVQLVQQDSRGSLDPRMTVGDQLVEILKVHGIGSHADRPALAAGLLEQVGLDGGLTTRFPHMLSGGQRQRVVIARALSLAPSLLVCDEAVSSLDVVSQAQIIQLLASLNAQRGVTLVFITHDLRLAQEISGRLAVMQHGEIVEFGATRDVLAAPQHSYTGSLVAAAAGRRCRQESGPAGRWA